MGKTKKYQESKGHLTFMAGKEYFRGHDGVYVADIESPIDEQGWRVGARFYCTFESMRASPSRKIGN